MIGRLRVPLLRSVQGPVRAFSNYGYLGKSFSFGNVALGGCVEAAHLANKDHIGFPNAEKLMMAIQRNEIELGILPVETSTTGVIGDFYDSIVSYPDISIVAEYSCKEILALAVNPGTKLPDVRRIAAHAPILAKCSKFIQALEESRPDLECVAVADAAPAGRLAKSKDPYTASVSTKAAAEHYGLDILNESVGNDKNSQTRYLLLSKNKGLSPPGYGYGHGQRHATMLVVPNNELGSLARMLTYFSYFDIPVVNVVGRPVVAVAQEGPVPWVQGSVMHWEYVYFVEYTPSHKPNAAALLESLIKHTALYCRSIGDYPAFVKVGQFEVPIWKEEVGAGPKGTGQMY